MAYDKDLVERIRELLADEAALTEQRMFGGLACLIGGNMAVAASSRGGLLVRVDPTPAEALLPTTNARPMKMRGREMRGWLRIDSDELRTRRQLDRACTRLCALAAS